MKYPTYLENHIKDIKDKYLSTMTLCDKEQNENIQIYYYGELISVKGEKCKYIVDTKDKPMKIIGKTDIDEFIIYDGAYHGYDNMFCNEYTNEQIENRPLKKLEIPSTKIILELGYSIDYDDEIEDYEYTDDKKIKLINEDSITLEDLKANGYDYLSLSYQDKNGAIIQFVDVELA